MHIHKRLLVVTALLMGLLPLSGALHVGATLDVAILQKQNAEEQMDSVLEDAKDGYRKSAALSQGSQEQKRIVATADRRLRELEKRKIELRARIVSLIATVQGMENRADTLAMREERSILAEREERERLTAFVRQAHARGVVLDDGNGIGRVLVRRIFGLSLGETVDEDLRNTAIARAQEQIITAIQRSRETALLAQGTLHASAGAAQAELAALLKEREGVLQEYNDLNRSRSRAQESLELSEERLADIVAETEAVQREVLRMQGELERIDERLRVRAERELIQMGLREERPDWLQRKERGPVTFVWPASGPVSAGFQNVGYKKYFGVPHKGMDIVVGQGTEVIAAADGVVFLARDGGLKGFSYILIGHRDGYATLYGHLSSFAVATGQDVRRGQVIGLSGGRPGTHGAGPMTTGAHLHFEMMQNGVHIDPKGKLP